MIIYQTCSYLHFLNQLFSCRHQVEEPSIELLSKAGEEQPEVSEETEKVEHTCTRCQDASIAVKYCTDCGDKICEKHFQVGINEQIVLIAVL